MQKKRLFKSYMICFICLFVLAAGPAFAAGYTGEGQKPLVLKIGSEIPASDPVSQAPIRFAQRMKERTNGKIQMTYLPESQLGNWQQMLEAVRSGSLSMMYSPAGGSKEYYVTMLPFLFRDFDHVKKVMDGPIRDGWTKRHMERTGIYIFGWQLSGLESMFFTKTAVTKPADMKGMKFRVPQDKVFMETFGAIGARPTPIPMGDLYIALRQGVVDGVNMPTQPVVAFKYYEVLKYGLLTHHRVSIHLMHTNGDVWKSLTPETQKLWMDTWKEVSGEVTKMVLDAAQTDVTLLKSKGMTFPEPDIPAFVDATKDVWKKMLSDPEEIAAYQAIKAVK